VFDNDEKKLREEIDYDDKKLSKEMIMMDVTTRYQVMISLDKSSQFP